MALFNRKKTDPKALPEIDKYYEAEKRERMGLAWILAVISIACVGLLLIGAFFGGKWVYRKATQDNKKAGIATTAKTESEISQTKETSETPKTEAKTPSDTSSTKTPDTIPRTPIPSVPFPKPTAPATTPTPKALANTGPTNTIVVFLVSAIGFAGLHNFLIRRSAGKN